jgi:phospholipid-binding lipoprotein MlaA
MCGARGVSTTMRGVLSVLGFAALVAAPGVASAQEAQSDPWEGFNRNMYAVHEGVDQAVLEPVARGYRAITPRPVRQGVRNFLRNLRAPVIFVNDVLQGEVGRAGTTVARFGVNTTIGIGGVFDPATSMGLERHDEDFGQTLAVWGVDSGPYIFVPLLGPTTVRDGAGRIVDIAFDPLTWAEFDEVDEVRIGRTVLAGVSARELVLETVDDIRRDSPDPYVTIRSSYGLLRESAIQNGPTDVQDLPEFEDIDEQPATEEPAAEASEENSQQSSLIENTPYAVTLAKSFSVTTSLAVAGDWK